MKKIIWLVVLGIVSLLSLVKVIFPIWHEVFPFTFDQARDMLWVRNQVVFHKPSLVGPWGSLEGVFFGPLWFWLLILPYLLSGGSPVASTLFNALVVFSAVILMALYLKKINPLLAIVIFMLGLSSPYLFNLSQYAFSQHLLPILTVLFVFSLAQLWQKWSEVHISLALLSWGLMFHAEPPTCLFSLPILLWVIWKSPQKTFSWRITCFVIFAFILPFIPSLLFDIRHDFIQLKSFFAYISGSNQSLGDILPFAHRLWDRPWKFLQVFQQTFLRLHVLVAICMFVFTWAILLTQSFRKWLNSFALLPALFTVSWHYLLSLLLIFILFPPELKLFYLDGISVVYFFWLSLCFCFLFYRFRHPWLWYGILACFVWFNWDPLNVLTSIQQRYEPQRHAGSIYKNQKAVVDWIYQDAQGKGFKVYTYVPAVYDYPYQYLFLSHGEKTYGYLPQEFAYFPQVPPYVEKKDEQIAFLQPRIKPVEDIFYLILETDDYARRRTEWLEKFSIELFPVLATQKLPGGIVIEKRQIPNQQNET